MAFVVTGTKNGERVYWRKWTGASSSGRPKWVPQLTLKCLYVQRRVAEKTVEAGPDYFGSDVKNVEVEEVTSLPV